MDSLTELFCLVDDFYKAFEPQWETSLLLNRANRRRRMACLGLSEIMTLMILFHQMRFRQFKVFYQDYVCRFLKQEFPHLPSYNRMVEFMPRCAVPLAAFFETLKGKCTGISIVDSSPISVCDNLRIYRHRVFAGLADRGKSSTGWFFGFKLHIIINHMGELINFKLTPGNVDDRKPVPNLVKTLVGMLLGDKGYISVKLKTSLLEQGLVFLTKVRRNMKKAEHSLFEKALLKKRSLIETVFDELKNLCQIEHTRHRSPFNFIVNLLSGIIAYCLMPKKPKIQLFTQALT